MSKHFIKKLTSCFNILSESNFKMEYRQTGDNVNTDRHKHLFLIYKSIRDITEYKKYFVLIVY